jgi:hypothetical protein
VNSIKRSDFEDVLYPARRSAAMVPSGERTPLHFSFAGTPGFTNAKADRSPSGEIRKKGATPAPFKNGKAILRRMAFPEGVLSFT